MNKYNTDCFLHNVLLDSLNLQRQLCISRPFGTWFLYSKKSPLFTFYGAFWSKIGDLNSHPQFGKLMCWPLTLILHIKVGSQALPVPYLTWFFDEMVSPQTLRLFLRRLLRKSYERDYLIFTSIYDEKTPDLPLNAKKHPYFRFESRGVFAPVSVFSLTVSSLFYRQTILQTARLCHLLKGLFGI